MFSGERKSTRGGGERFNDLKEETVISIITVSQMSRCKSDHNKASKIYINIRGKYIYSSRFNH